MLGSGPSKTDPEIQNTQYSVSGLVPNNGVYKYLMPLLLHLCNSILRALDFPQQI